MTKTKRINPDMTEGPLFSGILRYTIPVILAGVLQQLFSAADMAVVGRFCNSLSLGAVGATVPITNLLLNFFIGLSVGVGIAVAQSVGARNAEQTGRLVHTTPLLVLVCGVLISLVGVLFAEPILIALDTPENVLPLSIVYMRIIFAGATFSLAGNFFASILRAVGETNKPMLYFIIAGILNVVLNVVFVVVLHMNVAGVALATILSQALSAALMLRDLMRREDACRIVFKNIRFCGRSIKKILQFGVPAGIQSCLFSISNVLIQSSINSFGEVVLAGNAGAQNIDAFIYISLNGFYHASLNFTAQNFGAKRYDRIWRVIGICTACGAVLGILLGVIAWLLGPHLLGFFITDSPAAIEYGMIRLTWLALLYFGCPIMEVASGALRGIGQSLTSMFVSVLGVCGIRIMWVLFIFNIPAFHTLEMLYFSYFISWILTAVGHLTAFVIVFHKHKKAGIA